MKKPNMLRLTDRGSYDHPLWVDGNRVAALEAIPSYNPPFGIVGTMITLDSGTPFECREHPDYIAGMLQPGHPKVPTP